MCVEGVCAGGWETVGRTLQGGRPLDLWGGSAVGCTTRQWVDPEYSSPPRGTSSLPPQGLGWCSRAAHGPVRMFGAAGKTVPIRTLIPHAPHPTRQLGGAVRKQHLPESITTKCTSHLCKLRKSILRRGFLFCPQEAEFASSRVPVWPPSALRWIPQPLRQRGFHGITVV